MNLIGKYGGNDPNMPTYEISPILNTDYVDITDIYGWFSMELEIGKDYIWCRDNAMIYTATIGFINLSYDHKLIAAKNFCVSKTDRDTILTLAEQESAWDLFIAKSKAARSLRWDKAKAYVSFRLTPLDSSDLAESTLNLNTKYIEYGIKNIATDNVDGIYDWVQGTGNYISTGFPSKSYWSQTIQDGIINILNG